jgi:Ca2+-binding RTX toxin-like protein
MSGSDLLTGLDGTDTLIGAEGLDTLNGGKGSDTLTGGDSEDAFVFAGPGTLSGVDTITDFEVGFDDIWLSAATFRKVGPQGDLTADRFALGSATEGDDRIIYDAATGALSYDADGNRSGAAVQFAQLATGLALTHTDFLIIA